MIMNVAFAALQLCVLKTSCKTNSLFIELHSTDRSQVQILGHRIATQTEVSVVFLSPSRKMMIQYLEIGPDLLFHLLELGCIAMIKAET